MELQAINMDKHFSKSNVSNVSNASKTAIKIINLSKSYKLKGSKNYIQALNGINLEIKKGEIFGLLGPNGAGKTTLISILTTLLQPDQGYATILGHNVLKDQWFVKNNVGLMLGKEMLYYRLTGYRNLKFYSKLYGINNYEEKINEIAKLLGLTDWIDQYASSYSEGMKTKLALARVLLMDPEILILDEPMQGLDPRMVREVIKILKELNKTIFLASHQMYIISKLCDKIGFLKEGKIIRVDSQKGLHKLISKNIKIKIKLSEDKRKFLNLASRLDFITNLRDNVDEITLFLKNESYYPKLMNILKEYPIIEFNQIKPDLNDVFIKLSKT